MNAPLLAPSGDPHAVAATDGTTRLTYAELAARIDALATRLAAAGLRRGDRIATLTDNSVDQVVLFHACVRTGVTLAPLSWRAAPTELAAMLTDCAPELLATTLAHQDLAGRTAALLDAPPRPALLGAAGIEHSVPPVRQARPAEPAAEDDPVLLIYTSGSSGRPKGVPLTAANCVATNDALASRFPLDAEDRVLLVLPQFHVAAWNVQPLLAWHVGARVVVVPTFDPATVLAAIARERVTAMMGVPTTYEMLAGHPDFATTDLSSLRTCVVGGAPADERLGRAWAARGIRLWAGYGLTEAGPNVLCEPPGGDAGPWLRPYDGVSVRLDDQAQLLVRGGGVFHGYWSDEDATRRVLRDGWLATGDVAEERDGSFRLRGRSNEKYISGGENVHPAEVERALRMLDDVAEAAVVGVPDSRWGEVGVAFVVLSPTAGRDVTPEQVRTDVRTHLAGFKVPREVIVVPELPRTGSGKLDKRSLRAQVKEDQ